jgi:hypothetical protein
MSQEEAGLNPVQCLYGALSWAVVEFVGEVRGA